MNETDMTQEKLQVAFEAVELPALGYGNPEATISYTKHKENGELTEPVEAAMVEIITSGECLVEVTEKDDGCIDGRPAIRVTYADAEGNTHEVTVNPDGANIAARS